MQCVTYLGRWLTHQLLRHLSWCSIPGLIEQINDHRCIINMILTSWHYHCAYFELSRTMTRRWWPSASRVPDWRVPFRSRFRHVWRPDAAPAAVRRQIRLQQRRQCIRRERTRSTRRRWKTFLRHRCQTCRRSMSSTRQTFGKPSTKASCASAHACANSPP